jgi:ferrochelatase
MEGRASFLSAGGKEFHYVPALNEHPQWIAALGKIALDNLGGWLGEATTRDADEQARQISKGLALTLGAPR